MEPWLTAIIVANAVMLVRVFWVLGRLERGVAAALLQGVVNLRALAISLEETRVPERTIKKIQERLNSDTLSTPKIK